MCCPRVHWYQALRIAEEVQILSERVTVLCYKFNVQGSVHRKYIPIYVQRYKDMTKVIDAFLKLDKLPKFTFTWVLIDEIFNTDKNLF